MWDSHMDSSWNRDNGMKLAPYLAIPSSCRPHNTHTSSSTPGFNLYLTLLTLHHHVPALAVGSIQNKPSPTMNGELLANSYSSHRGADSHLYTTQPLTHSQAWCPYLV